MLIKIEQAKVALYSVAMMIKNKLFSCTKKTSNEKIVLIVFQQIFGDAVLLSTTLEGYVKLFPKEKGYKILLLCRPSVKKFMKDVLLVPSAIQLQEVDFSKLVRDCKYFRFVLNEYVNNAEVAIIPGSSMSAEILMTAASVKRKIGLVQCEKRVWPPASVFFQKHAYTEYIRPKEEMMVLQRHKLLMQELGLKNFRSCMPRLLPQKKIFRERPYYVVCPGASKPEKCWPLERFVQIIDFIIDELNVDAYICGGADEATYAMYILENTKHPSNVYDFVGKTTFCEWAEIVQNAECVIGNDSATLHLAAASGRKAICIAGVYDKGHFFPYSVDELKSDERLPITLYVDVPCELCRTKGYYSGYGNAKCKKTIQENKCALCVDAITVDDVKQKIK